MTKRSKIKKEIEFKEYLGEIRFTYDNLRGKIPKEIVKNGEQAIRDYVYSKVEKADKAWKKAKSVEEKIRKNHIQIKTKCKDGTTLEGRIVEATSRCIKVELDKPVKGESNINFGFASAVVGHYVFEGNHELSHHAYEAAYTALHWAYEKTLNQPVRDLVKILNNGRKND